VYTCKEKINIPEFLISDTIATDHSFTLKGQCHEIFDTRFFRQSITPRPLINTLKYSVSNSPSYLRKCVDPAREGRKSRDTVPLSQYPINRRYAVHYTIPLKAENGR
jgi:hypothetical protein